MGKITILQREATKFTTKESIYVKFDYDMDKLAKIKSLPKRFYIPATKEWEVPIANINNVLALFQGEEIEILGKVNTKISKAVDEIVNFEKIDFEGFEYKTEPFQHQVEFMQYAKNKNKFLLGDEQGLGKTKQAIDLAVARKSQFKHCLIVCGVNALKWNWENEIKTHSNEKGRILGIQTKQNGKRVIGSVQDRYNDLCRNHDELFLITNIETLRDKKIQAKIKDMCEKGIIGMTVIDEIHKCKNAQKQQGKAIHNCKSFYKLAMTGTPLMNEPIDLYNILKWLDVEHHSFTAFRSRYCIMGGYGNYQIVGYKNLHELNVLLEANMLRRLKKDRLDLPAKIKTREYVELTPKQRTLYSQVEKDIKAQVDQIRLDPNPLSKLIRLRQVTGCPTILSSQVDESVKLDRMVELIDESVGNAGKVIVFSNWATMIRKAYERINSQYQAQVITGQTKDEDRIKKVEKFQTDEKCRVILGTIGAMGTGLTLTSADTVIFLDEPWNTSNKEQAEDRSHRIGQKKSVNIITLIAKDTIDERINAIVMKKGLMAEALVDGKIDKLSKSSMVDFLLDL